MSIATQCPKCSQKFNAPDQALGQSVRCSQCGNPFVVQAMGRASPPAARTAVSQSSTAPAFKPEKTKSPQSREPAKRSLWVSLLAAFIFLGGLSTAAYFVWHFFTGGPAIDWKEFISAEGGFTVLLPANPEQTELDDPKIVAANKIREVSAKPAGSRHYGVHFYDLPDRPINDYLYLSWLKNHLLEEGGKLARENEITPAPYPCKEIVVDLPNGQVLTRRIYLAEARVFFLTAEFPSTSEQTPETQKFFESFKITSVPKAERPAPVVVAQAEPKEVPAIPAPPPKKTPEQIPEAKADPPPAQQPEKEAPKKAPESPPLAKVDPPVAKKDEEELPAPNKNPAIPPVAKADPPLPEKETPKKAPEAPPAGQANGGAKSPSLNHPRSLMEIRYTLTEILAPDDKEADEKTQALRRLKAYRYLAEVPYKDLVLDDEYSKLSLAGAMLCEKIGKWDHKPKNPGIPEKEFQIAFQGTSKSNLFQGKRNLSGALDYWMDDSDPGNEMVGHRRWCLNPAMQKTGFARSGIFSAMYAWDAGRKKIPEYDYLCYPARGFMPIEFFGDRNPWNVMLNPKKYKAPGKDFTPKIYQADALGIKKGKPLSLDYKTVDALNPHVPSSIIFRPEKLDLTPGTIYVVELDGIARQGSGQRVNLSYVVEFMSWREGNEPPDLAKVNPAPDKGKFVLSPEDQALVDEINRFRKGEKSPLLQPVKDLFTAAQVDAKALSQKKGIDQTNKLPYQNVFHYSFPVTGSLSAREMVAHMTSSKTLKVQVADEDLQYIGIGSSTGADGLTYYMLIFCGDKR